MYELPVLGLNMFFACSLFAHFVRFLGLLCEHCRYLDFKKSKSSKNTSRSQTLNAYFILFPIMTLLHQSAVTFCSIRANLSSRILQRSHVFIFST